LNYLKIQDGPCKGWPQWSKRIILNKLERGSVDPQNVVYYDENEKKYVHGHILEYKKTE